MRYFLKTAIPLTIIAALAGILLAGVNLLTSEAIAENERKEKTEAVFAIFPEADGVISEDVPAGEITDCFTVTKSGKTVGRCVIVSEIGFKDAITVAVGVDLDGVCKGVRIVSMSETPGVGTKTSEESHLAQYIGKTGSPSLGKKGENKDVDAVTGATVSSKAVHKAVVSALAYAAGNGEAVSVNGDESENVSPESNVPSAKTETEQTGSGTFYLESIPVEPITFRTTTSEPVAVSEPETVSSEEIAVILTDESGNPLTDENGTPLTAAPEETTGEESGTDQDETTSEPVTVHGEDTEKTPETVSGAAGEEGGQKTEPTPAETTRTEETSGDGNTPNGQENAEAETTNETERSE